MNGSLYMLSVIHILEIMKIIIVILLGLISIQGCDSVSDNIPLEEPFIIDEDEFSFETIHEVINPVFNTVDTLTSLNQTNFVTTLESSINKRENSIYTATMLFAWNEIKEEINDSIINIEREKLRLMNASNSYRNVLNSNEYKTSISVVGNVIKAKALFKIGLPFYEPLTEFRKPFLFKNSEVKSFGFKGDDRTGRIAYYRNDKDFAIRLLPENRDHEIIIIKVNSKKATLLKYYTAYEKRRTDFKTDTLWWKHKFYENDVVQIPFIEFNIYKDYNTIIDSYFSTVTKREFQVVEANQKTAFILNEIGASAESYSVMEVCDAAGEINFEKPEPKHMIFDTDFVIFLKRKNANYPYFGAYIANDELMVGFDDAKD
jgi:hypothetical protein